jgi:hypothetical protein
LKDVTEVVGPVEKEFVEKVGENVEGQFKAELHRKYAEVVVNK